MIPWSGGKGQVQHPAWRKDRRAADVPHALHAPNSLCAFVSSGFLLGPKGESRAGTAQRAAKVRFKSLAGQEDM